MCGDNFKIDDEFSIHISDDGLCDLNEVFEYGNILRAQERKHELSSLEDWLQLEDVVEFMEVSNSSVVRECGEVRSELLLAIKAVSYHNPDFEVRMQTQFLHHCLENQ